MTSLSSILQSVPSAAGATGARSHPEGAPVGSGRSRFLGFRVDPGSSLRGRYLRPDREDGRFREQFPDGVRRRWFWGVQCDAFN